MANIHRMMFVKGLKVGYVGSRHLENMPPPFNPHVVVPPLGSRGSRIIVVQHPPGRSWMRFQDACFYPDLPSSMAGYEIGYILGRGVERLSVCCEVLREEWKL